MIPTIDDILRMLVAGECTQEQALQWIGAHIDTISSDVMMRDHMAAMMVAARDGDGNLLPASVEAVMGAKNPPEGYNTPEGRKERFEWWCTAEARIRYAKADAMMVARLV